MAEVGPAPGGSGHGWVYPNASGRKSNCGGPTRCRACAEDQKALRMAQRLGQEAHARQYPGVFSATADLLDAMKGDLLITLVNRLGGEVRIPVSEVDGAGKFGLNLQVDQASKEFVFTVVSREEALKASGVIV